MLRIRLGKRTDGLELVTNGNFENGTTDGWEVYDGTLIQDPNNLQYYATRGNWRQPAILERGAEYRIQWYQKNQDKNSESRVAVRLGRLGKFSERALPSDVPDDPDALGALQTVRRQSIDDDYLELIISGGAVISDSLFTGVSCQRLVWNEPLNDMPPELRDASITLEQDDTIGGLFRSFINQLTFWGDGYRYLSAQRQESLDQFVPVLIEFSAEGDTWEQIWTGEINLSEVIVSTRQDEDLFGNTIIAPIEDTSVEGRIRNNLRTRVGMEVYASPEFFGLPELWCSAEIYTPPNGVLTRTEAAYHIFFALEYLVTFISDAGARFHSAFLFDNYPGYEPTEEQWIITATDPTDSGYRGFFTSMDEVISLLRNLWNVGLRIMTDASDVTWVVLECRSDYYFDAPVGDYVISGVRELSEKGKAQNKQLRTGFIKDAEDQNNYIPAEYDTFQSTQNEILEREVNTFVNWPQGGGGTPDNLNASAITLRRCTFDTTVESGSINIPYIDFFNQTGFLFDLDEVAQNHVVEFPRDIKRLDDAGGQFVTITRGELPVPITEVTLEAEMKDPECTRDIAALLIENNSYGLLTGSEFASVGGWVLEGDLVIEDGVLKGNESFAQNRASHQLTELLQEGDTILIQWNLRESSIITPRGGAEPRFRVAAVAGGPALGNLLNTNRGGYSSGIFTLTSGPGDWLVIEGTGNQSWTMDQLRVTRIELSEASGDLLRFNNGRLGWIKQMSWNLGTNATAWVIESMQANIDCEAFEVVLIVRASEVWDSSGDLFNEASFVRITARASEIWLGSANLTAVGTVQVIIAKASETWFSEGDLSLAGTEQLIAAAAREYWSSSASLTLIPSQDNITAQADERWDARGNLTVVADEQLIRANASEAWTASANLATVEIPTIIAAAAAELWDSAGDLTFVREAQFVFADASEFWDSSGDLTQNQAVYFFDLFPNAQSFGHSFRKLRRLQSEWMIVRRADGAQQTIGFSGGLFDLQALKDFCGTQDGFCAVSKNQGTTGPSFDLIGFVGEYPQVYDGTAQDVLRNNDGEPCVYYTKDRKLRFNQLPNGYIGNQLRSTYVVAQNILGALSAPIGFGNINRAGTGEYILRLCDNLAGGFRRVQFGGNSYQRFGPLATAPVQYSWIQTGGTVGDSVVRVNSVTDSVTGGANQGAGFSSSYSNTEANVGYDGQNFSDMYLTELVGYAEDGLASGQAPGIEASQQAAWGV